MSDTPLPPGTMSILREVLDAWLNRNERKAARGAGGLTFWRDGMLGQLEAIEKNGPTPEVVNELKKNFEDSKQSVEAALEQLRSTRSKVGPSRIGVQLDAILHHDTYGKSNIRNDIEQLIFSCEETETPSHLLELKNQHIRTDAQYLRLQIEAFNAEVRRLQRLVWPSN